jgi:hypothetical protein
MVGSLPLSPTNTTAHPRWRDLEVLDGMPEKKNVRESKYKAPVLSSTRCLKIIIYNGS